MNYYINSIKIYKVHNLKNVAISIDSASDAPRHLIITGANGSGKTSLLEAMKQFLSCAIESDKNTRLKDMGYKFEQNQDGIELTFGCSLDSLNTYFYDRKFVLAYFDAHHEFRAIVPEGIEKVELQKKYNMEERTRSLFLKYMLDLKMTEALAKNNNKAEKALEISNWFAKIQEILREVYDDENDEYLGTISLKEIDFENENAEYAIVLRKKAQGKGIATEATRLVLDAAFNKYCIHRVYLTVLADNKSAIKLYERCGFKLEGEFREHLKINGKYVNWKWYGILRQDFQ